VCGSETLNDRAIGTHGGEEKCITILHKREAREPLGWRTFDGAVCAGYSNLIIKIYINMYLLFVGEFELRRMRGVQKVRDISEDSSAASTIS
jgi:hypothetical protein